MKTTAAPPSSQPKIVTISFADVKLPSFPIRGASDKIAFYGEQNNFPEKLVELYNRSPNHGAIVKYKVGKINGKDILIEGNKKRVHSWNKDDSLKQFRAKLINDYELFGGYSIEVLYDRTGKVAGFFHIPFSKIRTLDHSCYQYWPQGSKTKSPDIKFLYPYNPEAIIKDEKTKGYYNQIIYYRDYAPDMGVYPLPPYIQCMQYIEVDVRIANFHRNNIATGFSAGTLIQMFKGEISDEDAREIKRMFKGENQGDDSAGSIILQYNRDGETPATITPLRPANLSEQFIQLSDSVTQNVFTGSQMTSKMLLGIAQAGSLGGRDEIRSSYEMFYNDYVEPRTKEFDTLIDSLLYGLGEAGKCKTLKAEPIGQDYLTLYEKKIITLEYCQENLGVPIEQITTPTVDTTQKFSAQNTWQEDDLEVMMQFGEYEIEYDLFLSFGKKEDLAKVLSIISKNEKASIQEISKATEIDSIDVLRILKQLDDDSLIKWTKNVKKITDDGDMFIKKNDIGQIVLRYKYQVSPEAAPLKGQSRPFCKKLVELGRVYSREDIDKISGLLGYDVWKRRGGWYHNPETDVNIPHCRHEWAQVLLRKKS